MFCTVVAKNENSIFVEILGPASTRLPYLNQNDTVKLSESVQFKWDNIFANNILHIKRFTNSGEWEQEWSFSMGDMESKNQYVALRIETQSEPILCWVEIEISSVDGSVKILEKKCVENEDLIIGM